MMMTTDVELDHQINIWEKVMGESKEFHELWKKRGLHDSWSKLHVNAVSDDWQLKLLIVFHLRLTSSIVGVEIFTSLAETDAQ
mgnify:CR=1 FL=1